MTLSLQKDQATAAPGYGFVGAPAFQGWARTQANGDDVYSSPRMVVTVEGVHPSPPPPLTIVDISKFFNGSTPGAHITITTPDGKKLLEMTDWSMSVPNHKDGNAGILNDLRPGDQPFFQVGADFVSPDDEHYYGLGQNHEGYLDHRGHTVDCWHNYTATAAPSVCIPFVVTNYGYGMIWDNPSRTTIEPGFNERTKWISEVGNRVSFFVIAGATTDEIYSGYRLLTGATPLMPKAAYGFVQCKQRYITQDEMLAVAKGYRDRHLPADVLVLDWFYYTKMGEFDFNPEHFPDPAAMNKQLHDMGFQTMISVWPRFTKGSRFYDFFCKKDGSSTSPTALPLTVSPTTAPDPTSIPPIPTPRAGIGKRFATTSSAKDSTRSGPTKPSLTCLRTAAIFPSVRARATSIFIRWFTPPRSMTVTAATFPTAR